MSSRQKQKGTRSCDRMRCRNSICPPVLPGHMLSRFHRLRFRRSWFKHLGGGCQYLRGATCLVRSGEASVKWCQLWARLSGSVGHASADLCSPDRRVHQLSLAQLGAQPAQGLELRLAVAPQPAAADGGTGRRDQHARSVSKLGLKQSTYLVWHIFM